MQVELINSWEESGSTDALFALNSPYRSLQDDMMQNSIFLKAINKSTSVLFKKIEKPSKLQEKIESLLAKDQKPLSFSDDPNDKLVFWNLPKDVPLSRLKLVPSDRMVLFVFDSTTLQTIKENESISKMFYKIYTWDPTITDEKRFFTFHIPCLTHMQENLPSFSDRKLALNEKELSPLSTEERMDMLKNHKFFLCNPKALFSEESIQYVFKAFACKTIPISFHPEKLETFVPRQCFINATDFCSSDELEQHLSHMSEESYQLITHNIKTFLESSEAKVFSMESFSKNLIEAVEN